MTMSDGALDLSISSYAPRPHDQVSSDSGRASSDSTSSEVHDDVKTQRLSSSSPHGSAMVAMGAGAGPASTVAYPPSAHIRDVAAPEPHPLVHRPPTSSPPPPSSNNSSSPPRGSRPYSNPTSPARSPLTVEGDRKPCLPFDRISDARVAPIRPFKMYPVDPFNMYGNPLVGGGGGGGGTLSPSPVGMHSLYDSSSPSGYPSFPLTPLTSHLLQRKRRAESREIASSTSSTNNNISNSKNSSNSTIKSESAGMGSASDGGAGIMSMGLGLDATSSTTSSSNSLHLNSNFSMAMDSGFSQSRVSTSSPGRNTDSNESDGEKKMKMSLDMKKDEAYWDRRRKNNEAAKRSRDARRQKEEEIAMRAAFLEQENLKLRAQVAILKNETAKLHYMLYNRI